MADKNDTKRGQNELEDLQFRINYLETELDDYKKKLKALELAQEQMEGPSFTKEAYIERAEAIYQFLKG